jgi:hypothetical protein
MAKYGEAPRDWWRAVLAKNSEVSRSRGRGKLTNWRNGLLRLPKINRHRELISSTIPPLFRAFGGVAEWSLHPAAWNVLLPLRVESCMHQRRQAFPGEASEDGFLKSGGTSFMIGPSR